MEQKNIVLTMYGTGEVINNVTVSLFDASGWGRTADQNYCHNINALELKDDNWIYAFTVKENEKYRLERPVNCDLEILASLDDRAIQRVIREIDNDELAKALKSAEKNILIAVLGNMSKRAAKMLIENMEYMGPVRDKDIQGARDKVVSIIRHLEDTGEIIIQKFCRDKADKGALSNNEINTLLSGGAN
jgi:hypothetical protein